MKILVTGGAGFIGSHYVRTALIGSDPSVPRVTVTVIDNLTYAGNLTNLKPVWSDPRLTFVHGDICDAGLLAAVVPGHHLVLNFAAETHVDRSITGAAPFVRTNVVGTHTLMQACLDAGTPRVVHVSTDEVYGSIDRGSWLEDAPLSPSSPYAATKAGGDLIALSYARTHSLNVSVTRCCNTYGPYQFPEKIIPLFITNLLDRREIPLYGDGENVRGWVHVDDHCRGIRIVAEHGQPGAVYHISGDTELTNRSLAAVLLSACGAGEDKIRKVEDRKGHDRRYSLDDSLLRRMGYSPATAFADGLSDTVKWYADNRGWWEPLRAFQPLGADDSAAR